MIKESKADVCFWGAYCAHATLTDKLNVYHCPFGGVCFKRVEAEKKAEKNKRTLISP